MTTSWRPLLVLALVLVAVPFGLLVDQVNRDGPATEVDTWVAQHLHDVVRGSSSAVDALQVVSFLGKPWFLAFVSIGAGALLLGTRRVALAGYVVATTVVGGLIHPWVKGLVERDRPSFDDPVASASGYSFPSGHAMSATVAYGALLLVVMSLIPSTRRPAAIAATIGLVALIGFTRLALGVHYLTDVVGGFALGGAWLAMTTAALQVWRDDRTTV